MGDRGAGSLLASGNGDGPAVVLDDEQEGEVVKGGEVERLVEIPLRGGAVAGGDVDDFIGAAELAAEGDADSLEKLGADTGRLARDAQLFVRKMVGHHPPA